MKESARLTRATARKGVASSKRGMTGGRQGARRDCKFVAKMKLPQGESTALREIRGRKGRIGEGGEALR